MSDKNTSYQIKREWPRWIVIDKRTGIEVYRAMDYGKCRDYIDLKELQG